MITPEHPIVSEVAALRSLVQDHKAPDVHSGSDYYDSVQEIRHQIGEYVQSLRWDNDGACRTSLVELTRECLNPDEQDRYSNADDDYGDITLGRDALLLELLRKIHTDQKTRAHITKDFAQELFAQIQDAMRLRIREEQMRRQEERAQWEQEGGNVKETIIDDIYNETAEQYVTELDAQSPNSVEVETYLLNKTIETLGPLGNEQTADMIIEMILAYGGFMSRHAADALSAIDAAYAAHKILPYLKNKDEYIRRTFARVLNRLEFGRVGISEEGVRYLERVYDLGEYNNPDFFAQRLTGSGEIGIFDSQRRLTKYFKLDFEGDEEHITPPVLDFVYETLFTPREQETSEDRAVRESALKEFQVNYFKFYDEDFFKQTGVRFNNLSFRDQGQLLLFYRHADEHTRGRVLNLVSAYGEDGFRAFLSLEFGAESGNAILKIGESMEHAAAERIFSKYAEIVDASERVGEYVAQMVNARKENMLNKNTVTETLLRKGQELFIKYASYAGARGKGESATRAEKGTLKVAPDTQEILRQMESVKADILLFAAVCKDFSKTGEVDFEEISETDLHSSSPREIHGEKRHEMERIFIANRPQYTSDLLQEVLKDFRNAFKSDDARFFTLTHHNEIVSFMRLDELPNGNLYAGSLNVRTEARGSAIGSAMFKTVLEREGARRTIEAVVYEKNPMLKHYIDDFGFKITGEIPDYHGTGQKFFKIERATKVRDLKQWGAEESLRQAA